MLDRLIRPASVAILGASATRKNNGNVVVTNLRAVDYQGAVYPIHPTAAEIESYPALPAIEALPHGVDTAIISVPAPGVLPALRALETQGVATAIVMSSGFSPQEDAALRDWSRTSQLLLQGPNCMGLLNLTDGIPLYTAIPSARLRPGRAALIAQSGSAAIAVMNSTDVGFSKVITSGSQFRLTAADFLDHLAEDPATAVIGLVIESIPDPDRFADAVDRAHANGKAVVVLKVGQSDLGALATLAHTGALISSRDATSAYFRRHAIPTVQDYDELVAALETFAITTARPSGARIGIAGISGGEAALTCDLADATATPLATFTETTSSALRALLPGIDGINPIDFGASVAAVGTRREAEALDVIAADPGTDIVFVLQDAQHSLAWRSLARYVGQCRNVAELGERTTKPIVVVSSSGEALHPDIKATLDGTAIPLLRGLRPALAAMRCLGAWGSRVAEPRRLTGRPRSRLQEEIAAHQGPLPAALTKRLLKAYELPFVRTATVQTADEAVLRAAAIGYPLVVKILSPDTPHRSEIGAVQLGIADDAALRDAIAAIERNVRAARPDAVIEGYELQEQLTGWVEAMAGVKAAPPFGALSIIGSGGTLIELYQDRAFALSPVTSAEAADMIRQTRLGTRLDGYRNLLPRTDLGRLTTALVNLSNLAADLADTLAEADLNPILVQPGTGDVRIVDALFIASDHGRRP